MLSHPAWLSNRLRWHKYERRQHSFLNFIQCKITTNLALWMYFINFKGSNIIRLPNSSILLQYSQQKSFWKHETMRWERKTKQSPSALLHIHFLTIALQVSGPHYVAWGESQNKLHYALGRRWTNLFYNDCMTAERRILMHHCNVRAIACLR